MEPNQKTESNVAQMPERSGKVYNIEFTFNLGKKSQGRILTDFPQSTPPSEFARRMQEIDDQARRLQARYDLDELLEEMEQRESEVSVHKENRERSESEYRKARETLTVRIEEYERAHGDIDRNARQAFAAGPKRGQYKPDTQVSQRLSQARRLVSEAKTERAKLKAERKQANETLDVNIAGNAKAIARLQKKIDAKRELLKG